jgi:phenylacetate-coenzyme A ligase PaaK-like adenylate-forming protein
MQGKYAELFLRAAGTHQRSDDQGGSLPLANFYRQDGRAQREQSFNRLLQYLKEVVYPYHPAFRKACKESGIDPTRIRSYEDFQKIPLTTKADYRAAPLSYILQPVFPGKTPLYETTPIARKSLLKYAAQGVFNYPRVETGTFRKQDLKEKIQQRACREWFPIHTHASSGSTGEPTPAVYTHYDFTHVLPELASTAMLRADKPDPAVPRQTYDFRRMNIFPGAPHLAFFQTVFLKTLAGMNMFDTFGGKVIPTDRQIEIFANGGFNSMASIPSYAVYWLRRAIELLEAGKIKPFGPGFQNLALGGEAVSPSLKKHLHELAARLGAAPNFMVTETYGSTEAKWAGFECRENAGIHLNPRFFFWECLDPETKKPVAPGQPGVLVFSHVGWRGTAFIRYWTGDLVQRAAEEPCPYCGYTFYLVKTPIARVDKDFTKLKGVQVSLQQLVTVVRDTPGVRNCQVILEKEHSDPHGRDWILIRVLPEAGANRDKVASSIKDAVRFATEVSPDEIVFEENTEKFEAELFSRNGIKAEYLVERRYDAVPAARAASS